MVGAIGDRQEAVMAVVRVEHEGPVASIVLANPPLNLFTERAFDQLAECVAEVGRSGARAVVWRAEGDVFSAGVDVNLVERAVQGGAERADGISRPLLAAVRGIEQLEVPTLALIGSRCLTVGFEVALGCDLIWASESATFGLVEAVIGLTTVGATQRLAHRAGSGRARELVYTAGLYDAATLERWGVVNRVVPDDELLDRGMRFARKLADGPTLAHAATKRIVQAYDEGGVAAADRCAPARFAALFATDDLQGAVRSFLAEGPGKAVFEGR
jgi:enoyl-CoA hydratase/carnithine racemase